MQDGSSKPHSEQNVSMKEIREDGVWWRFLDPNVSWVGSTRMFLGTSLFSEIYNGHIIFSSRGFGSIVRHAMLLGNRRNDQGGMQIDQSLSIRTAV
jgi:hypothetical protein